MIRVVLGEPPAVFEEGFPAQVMVGGPVLGRDYRMSEYAGSAISSGLRLVANHFDVVPVGSDDEGGVVVRVVLRAQAGCAVVLAARFQRRAIESVDLPAPLRREGEVKARWGFRSAADAK